MEIFQVAERTYGGLKSIDCRTLSCDELRWSRIKVEEGSLLCIPHLISVKVMGRIFPVAITIDGDISDAKTFCFLTSVVPSMNFQRDQ